MSVPTRRNPETRPAAANAKVGSQSAEDRAELVDDHTPGLFLVPLEILCPERRFPFPDLAATLRGDLVRQRVEVELVDVEAPRIMGRHLDAVLEPVQADGTNVSPISWLFPADTVLEDARVRCVASHWKFVGQFFPIHGP